MTWLGWNLVIPVGGQAVDGDEAVGIFRCLAQAVKRASRYFLNGAVEVAALFALAARNRAFENPPNVIT